MQPSGKSKDDGIPYDKIDIEPLDIPDSKISEVWFDVSYPFTMLASPGHWAKKLTGETLTKNTAPENEPGVPSRPRENSRERDSNRPRFRRDNGQHTVTI